MTIPLSIIKALFQLITLQLRFPGKYCEKSITMDDGIRFKIFRHMCLNMRTGQSTGSTLIVRFKFKKFSHQTNICPSRIPILMIAGFPGFRDKIWMIDWETNYWQGVYEFNDLESIENYKKSFVLGLMNKRAIQDTLTYQIIPNQDIDAFLKKRLVQRISKRTEQ
jgi:hypothetical protein